MTRCDTQGCHREAVVSHRFMSGEEKAVEAVFCLPCRRVIAHASRVPWGDESEEWFDPDAWEAFRNAPSVRTSSNDSVSEGGDDG